MSRNDLESPTFLIRDDILSIRGKIFFRMTEVENYVYGCIDTFFFKIKNQFLSVHDLHKKISLKFSFKKFDRLFWEYFYKILHSTSSDSTFVIRTTVLTPATTTQASEDPRDPLTYTVAIDEVFKGSSFFFYFNLYEEQIRRKKATKIFFEIFDIFGIFKKDFKDF